MGANGYSTPRSRSASAFPADYRRVLEESNLPIEVATAIADRLDGPSMPSEKTATEAQPSAIAPIERARVLFEDDPHCPVCGHNRDTSSVSSVDNDDGSKACQMCGAGWRELPSVPVNSRAKT